MSVSEKEIAANFRRLADDAARADLSALTTRLIAERAAAMSEAAGWRAKYEHLKVYADSLAGERNALVDDLARLSTELVRVRGISSLAQVIPGPAVPEPGSIDEALKDQQQDRHHEQ